MAEPKQADDPYNITGTDLIVDGWFHERNPFWPGQAMSLKVEEVLHHHRSPYQDIMVFQSATYGRVLVLDGGIQLSERDEFAYQEMIAHIPLYAHPNPEKVLVIGGGDGGVLREIARHPCVKEIHICEIDQEVIDVGKKYLPFVSKGYDDPRVQVRVMDGSIFMAENRESFDVIITDSSDPPLGPNGVLFETSFYRSMFDSLREGGIVCTQGECIWLHLDLIRSIVDAISPFFTLVEFAYATIPSYPSGQLGFIVATKGRGSCKQPVRKPDEKTEQELKYYTTELHSCSFVLPAFARRAIFE